jgi:hypothetical protein
LRGTVLKVAEDTGIIRWNGATAVRRRDTECVYVIFRVRIGVVFDIQEQIVRARRGEKLDGGVYVPCSMTQPVFITVVELATVEKFVAPPMTLFIVMRTVSPVLGVLSERRTAILNK